MSVDANGGFVAALQRRAAPTRSPYKAQELAGHAERLGSCDRDADLPAGSGLTVKVADGKTRRRRSRDYRWIIEEDRTFYIDPNCTTNPPPTGVRRHQYAAPHRSDLRNQLPHQLHAGRGDRLHRAAVLRIRPDFRRRNRQCATSATVFAGPTLSRRPLSIPSQVALDPTKRYYISVLPGDAANPFNTANASEAATEWAALRLYRVPAGITTDGADGICHACTGAVTILTQPTPFRLRNSRCLCSKTTSRSTVSRTAAAASTSFAPNEPGLGGFNITLFDDAGGTGDATGQMTYDMFNQPLSNSLAGTIDPATDMMPARFRRARATAPTIPTQTGITGTIVTCPKYEADGMTLSPLAGQAVVANLMPGRYGVVATPAADRIGARRGVAADQYAGRPEGARLLPAGRRAELLPGIWAGRIPRIHRLRQPRRSSTPAWRASATAPIVNDLPGELHQHASPARSLPSA